MGDFLHLVGGVRRDAEDSLHGVRASYRPPALDDAPPRLFVGPFSFPQHQESAGSCVAHGVTAVIESEVRARVGADFQLCRLDVYRGARLYRGWENEDGGCLASDAVRWTEEKGLAPESLWPYDPNKVVGVPAPAAVANTRPLYRARWEALASSGVQITSHMHMRRTMVNMTFAVGGDYGRTDMSGGLMRPFLGNPDGWHDEAWVGYDLKAAGGPELWKWGSWRNHGVDHPDAETDPRFAHLKGKRGFTRVKFADLSDRARFGEVHGLVVGPSVEA